MTDLATDSATLDRDALARHVVERYRQGLSLSALSAEIGRSYGFVRRLLLDSGVRPRPRGGPRRRR